MLELRKKNITFMTIEHKGHLLENVVDKEIQPKFGGIKI